MKKSQLSIIGLFFIFLFTSVNLFAQTFNANPTIGCAPVAITFTPTGAYRFWFYFGDGSQYIDTVSLHPTVTHTYTATNTYNPYADIYDNLGNYIGYTYGSSGNIQVNGATINVQDTVCPTDAVNFCGSWPANSWNWNFGDGGTSSGNQCPQHTYTATGSYTVTLIENSSCGTQTLTKKVVVNTVKVPDASFNFNPWPNACPTEPVHFNANYTAKTYSWNFGDGSAISTQSMPVHSYTATGTHTITLTETNGCNNSAVSTQTISVSPNLSFPNGVGAYSNNDPACPGQQVNIYVNGNVTYPKYVWNFGDGSPKDSSGSSVYHTFSVVNNYTVTVKVTNFCGKDSVFSRVMHINGYVPFPNQSWFSLNVNSPVCPNSNVNLNAPNGYPTYLWNFGDGSPQQTTNFEYTNHTYGSAITTYTASIKITNLCGNDTTMYRTVQISNTVHFPTSNFNLNINSSPACPNTNINLYVNGNSYPTYLWNFGDGSPQQTTSNNNNNHTYVGVGTYTASVKVTNACGLDTTLYGTVQINNNVGFPNSNFNLYANSNPACPGSPVNLTAPNGYITYEWNFGDGSPVLTSNNNNYNHTYNTINTYTASVKITNACGKDTTVSIVLTIANNAGFSNLYFNTNPTSACPNESINLYASDGYARYVWNFGDGSVKDTTYASYANHSYTAAATYTASVTIKNGCAQETTIVQTIIISNTTPIPSGLQIYAYNSPACPQSPISFNIQSGFPYYKWNMGDGFIDSTSNSYYIDHTYSTAGTYTVSVKVKNYCGSSSTIYTTVVINNSVGFPKNNFSLNLSPNPVCPGGSVNISAPYGYQWYVFHYGDNSPKDSVTYSSSNHIYTAVGNYTVTVKIRNYCGKDTTISDVVQVKSNVGFTSSLYMNFASPACPNDVIYFYTSSGYATYTWNFGDGHTASGSYNANHTYTATGTYTVSLKIGNQCGIDTTIYNTEIIDNTGSFPSWMSMDANPATACPNDLIRFDMNPQGFTSYFWTFGDGDTITTKVSTVQHGYTVTGVYTASCKVTNGCGKTATVYKTVQVTGNAPVAQIKITIPNNPACPNDNVFFLVQQGQPTYTYFWDFGDGKKDTTVGGNPLHSYTAAGTYTINMTAVNGCGNSASTSTTINITNNAYPVFTMPGGGDGGNLWGIPGGKDGQSAGCAGDVISFYFIGSNPNNLWDFGDGHTGVATQNMILATNNGNYPIMFIKHAYASNGTYTVKLTLTDHCNKSATDSLHTIIGGNQLVNGQLNTSPPPFTTCASIDFVAFGGATYKFDFGDGNTLTTSSPTASHIYAAQGNYVASVLITNGCTNTASYSLPINVNGAGGPSLSIFSSVNPSCLGNDGSATVNATGGVAPYTYAWDNGETTTTATGLSAGTYVLTVTDNLGCPNFIPVTLNNPAPIVLASSTTQANCGVANGTATVTITSGGNAPFTYQWSSGSTSAVASGLGYGSYSVNVTDVNGCSSSKNISISELNTATVSVNSITNTSCNGGSNGVIAINVIGGNPPFVYAWSNGATTQNASNLAAGTYSVLVTDNGSCKATYIASVGQPTAIVAATSVSVSPTCGNFDGKATANPSGGTSPYTYLWDSNAANQTTKTATGLPAGTYSVTVTDFKGCTNTGFISLSNSNAPVITSTVVNVTCNGLGNGMINLNVSGGNGSYLYTWSSNVGGPQINHQNVNTLSPGNYIVTVQDAAHCFSFNNYTITEPAVLTASVTNTGATCGNNDGTATAIPSGGNIPYSYSWTGGQTTQTAVGLALGNRTVTVTDSKGCTTTATTTVTATTISTPICLVTVDSISQNNIITWSKPVVTNIDSFIVYREISANNYKQIGALPYDSLSMFKDTVRTKYFPNTGNPNAGTYRYKIAVRDICGQYSLSSPYHNTIYITNNNGTFSWPQLYTIEGSANPVTTYDLMRDDNSTGNWQTVQSVAGTQQIVSDPAYATYSVTASWRVETQWGISCTPTIINPKNPELNSINLNSSRSNVYRFQNPTNVINTNADLIALVYPNPSSGVFTVDLKNNFTGSAVINVFNMMGEKIYSTTQLTQSAKLTLNLSKQAQGVYYLQISTADKTITKKIVIE